MATNATKNLTAQDYFSTTLSAGITSSTTTIPLNSVPSGSEGFLVIDPDNASKEIIFYNAKSASDVTVPSTGDRGRGGTSAVAHSSGSTVKMMVNSDYVKEIQNGHAMGDAFLVPNHLVASTGTSWAWQSWTPTWTNVSGGTLNYAKYIQIGKTVHYRIKYTMAGANVSGLINVTVPVAMHSDYGVVANVDIVGIATFLDVGAALYHGVALVDSGKLNIRVSGSAGTYSNPADVSSTVPFTWGNTDVLTVSGTYEAA